MNKDQVKGQAKTFAGKIQEAAGKLVDSKSQQRKGSYLQKEGAIQQGYGNAKEVAKDVQSKVKQDLKSRY